jgi:hypothetical protein
MKQRSATFGFVLLSLLALGAQPAKANLIVNGGFETGDFSGWTVSADSTGVGPAFYVFVPNSGTYFAFLGNIGGLGTLSQTVSDTAGQVYTLSMYLSSDGATPNEFKIQWNGTTLYDQTDLPNTSPSYNLLTFTVQGTGTDTLTLSERDDPGYLALDDVSLNSSGCCFCNACTDGPNVCVSATSEPDCQSTCAVTNGGCLSTFSATADCTQNGCVEPPITPTSTVTATPTSTPTGTPTSTPTNTPTPLALGDACISGTQCASTFCASGVCCNTACNDPGRSCVLPGRGVGLCGTTAGAEAPVASWNGTIALGVVLAAIGIAALRRRMRATGS